MKSRYVMLVIVIACVVVLLGLLWPLTTGMKVAPRIQKIQEQDELATSVQAMQKASANTLERAKALADGVGNLRMPLKPSPVSPFYVKEPVIQGSGKESPREVGKTTKEAPKPEEWPDIAVSGIVLGGKGSMALIGREIYRRGDKIAGFELTEVHREDVTFVSPVVKEKKSFTLKGWEEKGKTR